jgi:hypothetical protein
VATLYNDRSMAICQNVQQEFLAPVLDGMFHNATPMFTSTDVNVPKVR